MKFFQAIPLDESDILYLQKVRAVQMLKHNRQYRELYACRTTKARIAMKLIHKIENVFDV